MILAYHPIANEWSSSTSHYFGQTTLTSHTTYAASPPELQWEIRDQQWTPLVGIVVSDRADSTPIGQRSFYTGIARTLFQNGAMTVLFSMEEFREDGLTGWIYHPESNRWLSLSCPVPNVLYNRMASRGEEKTAQFSRLQAWCKKNHLQLVNSRFFDKWETYEALSDIKALQPYTLETSRVEDTEATRNFLQKYSTIYVKPRNNGKGIGIRRVHLLTDETLQEDTPNTTRKFSDFLAWWESIAPLKEEYLLQQGIDPFKQKQKRFDFRCLVHCPLDDSSTLLGVGIRQSGSQDITTHVPRGGYVRTETTFSRWIPFQRLQKMVKAMTPALKEKYGELIEYTVDAGLDDRGKLYWFEVNAKPMLFNEKKIEEKRRQALATWLCQQAVETKPT